MKKWHMLGVLFLLLASCQWNSNKAKDYSQVFSEIKLVSGENPGFLSLQVSSSSEEEIQNVINSAALFDHEESNCSKYEDQTAYKRFFYYSCFTVDEQNINFYLDNSLLTMVYFNTPGLFFEEIYQIFGPPTSVYTMYSTTPRGPFPIMIMIYDDYGMVVNVLLRVDGETLYLDEDVKVRNVNLIDVDSVYVDENDNLILGDFLRELPAEYLYAWKGFGSIQELYPKMYYP